MKNMKIYRRATALALATSITLLTGCTGKKEETGTVEPQETMQPVEFYLSNEQEELQSVEKCFHVIVYFGEQAIVLRECEDYHIALLVRQTDADCSIEYDNVSLAKWHTQDYTYYDTNHTDLSAQMETAAIEKGAKVLKIK